MITEAIESRIAAAIAVAPDVDGEIPMRDLTDLMPGSREDAVELVQVTCRAIAGADGPWGELPLLRARLRFARLVVHIIDKAEVEVRADGLLAEQRHTLLDLDADSTTTVDGAIPMCPPRAVAGGVQ